MDKEKEITPVELKRGDASEDLWDEWPGDVVVNQTEVVTHQQSRVYPAPGTSERRIP